MSKPIIQIRNLTKTFGDGEGAVHALENINLDIEQGEIFGIIGLSGAGKSTLVRCMNLLEHPTSGSITVAGQPLAWTETSGGQEKLVTVSEKELRLARRNITMIFQGFNLLMQRTCLKNICFPLELAGVKKADAIARAKELLALVDLADKADAYPAQLSGGQQQRIAIARALATDPKVLLCDEATSALDPKTTHSILSLIRKINKELGITVIIITHQMSVVEETCNRVAILDGGEVVEQGNVSDVFSAPQSAAAKRLVFPETLANEQASEEQPVYKGRRIRIAFDGGETVSEPLIAKMAVDEGICASILSASTRAIGDKMYGNMLLGVNEDQADRAMAYLKQMPGITVQEV